jgi:thiamine monophosphate kinase
LLADLWHICEESGFGAEIFSDKIPVSDKSANLMDLITGGDDYQLCFTSSSPQIAGCYNIGRIIADKKLLLDNVQTSPKGYEHKV